MAPKKAILGEDQLIWNQMKAILSPDPLVS